MTQHIAKLLAVALAFAPADLNAQPRSTQSQDTIDVQHVMNAFHQATVDHDGTRLAALFVPHGSAWFNVLSDDAYARAVAKKPGTPKVRAGAFTDFAAFVAKSKAGLDPQHSNMHIHSDGTIASAYFDFRFLVDGREENRGSETWQLVKGAEGWRIAAITYSSTPASP